MTTAAKVELVASVREEYGLSAALEALELPRSSWYYHQREKVSYAEKYAHLQETLETIARKHPEYGIPRVTTELRETYQQVVNHKVVQRLLKLWDLSLLRSMRSPKPSPIRRVILKAGKRANLVAQMSQIGPFQVVYTDFTELVFADGTRKAHLMPIIGHASKFAFGWAVGKRANTTLAMRAWKRAKAIFDHLHIPIPGLVMHHDQDSVYTRYEWTGQLLLEDQVRPSYALNGARDNPEMESFIGRFKTENRSLLLDAQTVKELQEVVAGRMQYYNVDRRHSSLANQPPLAYIQQARTQST
ncbi:MAG: IS3 family transposase [Anaerolineales bacterium]|jgi:putative transposase